MRSTIDPSMKSYVILIRGINVGGGNKVPMAKLKTCLETAGYTNVLTYIASGNVILTSDKTPAAIKTDIERLLPIHFTLRDGFVKVLVLDHDQLRAVITNKPKGFGEQSDTYHSDAIFLIDVPAQQAMAVFDPRDGVDMVWTGDGVIYSQRLSSMRTKSRLGKIVGTVPYQSMTIRNWNTTTKLLQLLDTHPSQK